MMTFFKFIIRTASSSVAYDLSNVNSIPGSGRNNMKQAQPV